jgi:hypothetical protein
VKVASLALVALAATVLGAGCGSGSKSSAPPGSTTTTATTARATTHSSAGTDGKAASRVGPCLTTPAAVQRTLSRNLVLVGAKLSHPRMVQIPGDRGFYAVSARVSGMGKRDAVATWLVRSLDGKGVTFAIDAAAELISQAGGATGQYPDLTIDAPGVQKSRICAGGPGVDPGVTAPPPGGPGTPG